MVQEDREQGPQSVKLGRGFKGSPPPTTAPPPEYVDYQEQQAAAKPRDVDAELVTLPVAVIPKRLRARAQRLREAAAVAGFRHRAAHVRRRLPSRLRPRSHTGPTRRPAARSAHRSRAPDDDGGDQPPALSLFELIAVIAPLVDASSPWEVFDRLPLGTQARAWSELAARCAR